MKKIIHILIVGILVFSGLGVGAISIRMPSSQQSSSLDEYDIGTATQPYKKDNRMYSNITFSKIIVFTQYLLLHFESCSLLISFKIS